MRLFCDCKTDEEKSNFFLSGMAVETGVIAPAISNDVAMAYHRCAQFKKENDELRAKIKAMEQQEPVAWQTRTRPTWNDGTWGQWRKCSEEYAQDIKKTPLLHDWLYEARALYALPGAKGEKK